MKRLISQILFCRGYLFLQYNQCVIQIETLVERMKQILLIVFASDQQCRKEIRVIRFNSCNSYCKFVLQKLYSTK